MRTSNQPPPSPVNFQSTATAFDKLLTRLRSPPMDFWPSSHYDDNDYGGGGDNFGGGGNNLWWVAATMPEVVVVGQKSAGGNDDYDGDGGDIDGHGYYIYVERYKER